MIAETYREAQEGEVTGGHNEEYGDMALSLPPLWHACCPRRCVVTKRCRSPYSQFERLLGLMLADAKSLRDHLVAWYVAPERKVIQEPVLVIRKGRIVLGSNGQPKRVYNADGMPATRPVVRVTREIHRVWGVEPANRIIADTAIVWMDQRWWGECDVPKEIFAARAA